MIKAVLFDYFGVLAIHGVANEVLISVLQHLKEKGIKLFLISNANEEEASLHPKEFSALNLFNKRYYSWQTGYKKPDPQAYELILREQSLKPEEVIYFDDNEGHVSAAKALGIQSHVYIGVETVLKNLPN